VRQLDQHNKSGGAGCGLRSSASCSSCSSCSLGSVILHATSRLTIFGRIGRGGDRWGSSCPHVMSSLGKAGPIARKLAVALSIAAVLALPSTAAARAHWTPAARVLAIDDRNPDVAPYEHLLTLLQPKCRDARIDISRYAFNTKHFLQREGYSVSNLFMLRQANAALPAAVVRRTGRRPCAEVFAYVALAVEHG
jgi:hypothetical protein